MPSTARRERVRETNREEIKAIAWKQIRENGAAALSLRAIAREMGLTAPALYRYYTNRDELVTTLISDAHSSLTAALSAARDEDPESSPRDRLRAMCRAYYRWAAADPQRYLLVFTAPIPGYRMGPEAGRAADQSFLLVLELMCEADAAGLLHSPGAAFEAGAGLHQRLEAFQNREKSASPRAIYLALAAWSLLHGVTSLLVTGQYDIILGDQVGEFFEIEIEKIAGWGK